MATNGKSEVDKDNQIAVLQLQLKKAREEIRLLRSVEDENNTPFFATSGNFVPKYTKGPWHVFRVDDLCHSISSANGYAVTGQDLDFWFADDDENSMANAYLMAASPELYEALVSAKEQLKGYVESFLKIPFEDEQIDHAIAKAEGRIR